MLKVSVYYENENLRTVEHRDILINPALIVSIAEDSTDENYTEVILSGGIYYYVAMPLDVFLSYVEVHSYKRGMQ